MSEQRLGMICTGALAPGMNAIIAAITIRASELGWSVFGFHDGFTHLAQKDSSGLAQNTVTLNRKSVEPLVEAAGSFLRVARFDPISSESDSIDTVIASLHSLNIKYFVVVGGNQNMYVAHIIAQKAKDIQIVVIPKTIDNDVPLIGNSRTFGHESARVFGMSLVKNLIAETNSVPRWFIVEIMGNTTGHLALSVSASTNSGISVIPEDFIQEKITLEEIADVVEAGILKRSAMGSDVGVCIISEGIISKLTPESQEALFKGQDRAVLDGAELGRAISDIIRNRCAAKKLGFRFCPKKFGYELRGTIPTSGDCMLAKALGDAAVEALSAGKTDIMVQFHDGDYIFTDINGLIENGKIKTRFVNTNGREYKVVKKYQFNLRPEDLTNQDLINKMAVAGSISPEELVKKFTHAASIIVPIHMDQ